MKRLLASRPVSRWRILSAALVAPGAAVGMALALPSDNLAAATALCLLAVVAAAALAGRGSGVIASFVSFLGLNFFFTEPRHTLVVRHAEDWVALIAFLLSALIVGALLSRVLEERSRAEQRATEAQFLNRTTAKLISGEPFGRILDSFAEALVRLFALARCELTTPVGIGAAISESLESGGPSLTIPLATQSGSFGSLTAVRAASGQGFSVSEEELLKTLATQTALAVERASLDEEVRGARLDAEASRLRAALFSSVTHDLRTPLASIKASASGLLGKGASYSEAQRQETLRTVVEESDHLNQLVSNLLDLARMRAGALVPSTQPILIDEVIGSVLRRMKRTLERATVRTSIRPHLPTIEADPVQMEQVLANVIENAARFSSGGDIHISAAPWQETVQVRVADRGPGIPEEERTRVFEEFYRRDSGAGRAGTGLGLAIAHAIVVAHGGRIWAEAAPGGGTAILFELPIARSGSESANTDLPRQGAAQ